METLSAALLCWPHLAIKRRIPNDRIIKENTAAIDIPTTLLVVKTFFDPLEFDASGADGPSACFAGVFPEDGTTPEVGDPENDGAGGGVNRDVGAGMGAVELKGFPSFLQ